MASITTYNSMSKTSLHSVQSQKAHSIYLSHQVDSTYLHHTNNLSNADLKHRRQDAAAAVACQNTFEITSISSEMEEEVDESHSCASIQSHLSRNNEGAVIASAGVCASWESTACNHGTIGSNKQLKITSNEMTYQQRIIASMVENQRMPDEFLKKHTIVADVRAKMVDWMIEVTSNFKCSDQTFFLSVQYMDQYFSQVERSLCPSDLHLTGVACMFIACKYEEVTPLNLNTFFEKIGHSKLSKESIKRKEQEILQAIDFDVCSPSILGFIEAAVNQLNLETILESAQLTFFKKMSSFLAKLVCHEYKILARFTSATIAGSICYVSMKILQYMNNKLNLIEIVERIIKILDLENDEILKASTLVLGLAKNFEKNYPNLTNLKKLSADIQQLSAAATVSTTPSPLVAAANDSAVSAASQKLQKNN